MRTLSPSARRWLLDALFYGLSASFAAVAAVAADIPLQRTWGVTARWGYVGAFAVAVATRDRAPCSRSPCSRSPRCCRS